MQNVQANMIEQLFFELIQVAIGTRICLSHAPSADEWGELYAMAMKQSLVGVCFAGVQKASPQPSPEGMGEKSLLFRGDLEEAYIPEMLYFTWMGMAAKIQQRNETVNRQCVELQKRLAADGYSNYIMKGQANAALYQCGVKNGSESSKGSSLSALRQSGDIDVYLEGGLDRVLAYARTFGEVKKVNELEMSVRVFSETEVEFHYRPFIMRNPFKNRRLQAFFQEQSEACFTNRISFENKAESLEIMAPTIAFNLVHQIVHIYHHFITEGVGLRQLMDYHFVVKHEMEVEKGSSVQEVKKVISDLGLERFASALMWVIGYVFDPGMLATWIQKSETTLWKPNEKDGRLLLDEILMSGNFGHTDERAKDILTSRWKAFWFVNSKTFRFWRFDHWAWFWSPVWRVYHFLWRKMKGFK